FGSFGTLSGILQRQISNLLLRKSSEIEEEHLRNLRLDPRTLPVDRYYDALEGPELGTLKASEETVLPKDKKWPFLLRFPISAFGICLGFGSQAILWKHLATSDSTRFLHIVGMELNLVIWFSAIVLVFFVSSAYVLKIILYSEAVRREYFHPVRVNFFFAPWIVLLFLSLGLPPSVSASLPAYAWYFLMAPIFCLELKIYGQWMSGGERRLSKVANPSNHLAIVGNFVGALLGASMGLREGPVFFFAVGFAHYTVLFVTLYQRLPTSEVLPKELHPVFFLFVAAPSVASLACAEITGSFGYGSKIAYFVALFLYSSLAVRVNFFRGFKFSLAWWAYTFPMTGTAIATVRYADVVKTAEAKALALVLCAVSALVFSGLFATTVARAFVFRDLFPNDDAIAITDRKKPLKPW
ncbi:c4-dicarboxylate transporter/malic acid transport family protein, partial [Genlisea aurea]